MHCFVGSQIAAPVRRISHIRFAACPLNCSCAFYRVRSYDGILVCVESIVRSGGQANTANRFYAIVPKGLFEPWVKSATRNVGASDGGNSRRPQKSYCDKGRIVPIRPGHQVAAISFLLTLCRTSPSNWVPIMTNRLWAGPGSDYC